MATTKGVGLKPITNKPRIDNTALHFVTIKSALPGEYLSCTINNRLNPGRSTVYKTIFIAGRVVTSTVAFRLLARN